ncbi:MAG TPA: DUF2279 domain-containing protein [Candidatus Kapabacteria bacterium]|nr:DUF2279 domain-containing protein [Candidatus Kapabacteria bacterium]
MTLQRLVCLIILIGAVVALPAAAQVAMNGAADGSPQDSSVARAADTSAHLSGTVVTGEARRIDTTAKTPAPVLSSPLTDSSALDDPPRLAPEEYTEAGHLRYTLSGKPPYRETHILTAPALAFGGALLALATTITWYQQAWYPDSTKGPFHFQVDWTYAKEFDKIGHAFGGWMASYCSHEAFISCGLSRDDAALWGPIGGLFFQTFIEVQDGFHSNYGFDWTDELGNMAGAGYFYAQRKIPFLQNFDPKWSVGPTGRDSAREAAQIRSRLIVDDYDRQDMWLSVKLHNLLPENLQPFWPKWLQLAIGAGARDVELRGYTPYRVLHLSLDYNLVELLPDLGSFGNWLKQGLNAFHWPAPALQLWPKVKFELLYPFHL